MSFFNKLASAVTEHVGGYLTDQLIEALDPKVRGEVTEHVVEFKDKAVRDIPGTIEQKLTAGESSDSVVTSLLSSALSGRTGPLVEKVLNLLKPQIDAATQGLPDSITDQGIAKVREFLDFSQGKGEAEQTSRDLGGQVKEGLSSAVDGLLNLDDHLDSFLVKLKETLHPLFAALKPKLWETIPTVVQQALQAVLQPDGEGAAEQPPPQETSRGLMDSMLDFAKNTLSGQVVDQAPRVLEVVKDPIQDLIASIVDTLESQCNEAFGTKLKAELAERNLIAAQ